jgi:hypothetical protein
MKEAGRKKFSCRRAKKKRQERKSILKNYCYGFPLF